MTITRKLMLVVSLMVVLLLAGNLVVSVLNSRQYFSEQMQSLTEDTATSLGFSLSRAALEKDSALMQSMVDVLFDRAYYRSIVLRDTEGKVLVARSREIAVEGVPAWFIRFIDIPPQAGLAEVVSGWYQLGEVSVIAHPGYAYRELWRVSKEQLWLFLFAAALCYGLIGLALKHFLKPLTKVEIQAEAIGRKEFIVQKDLPSSPELLRIVQAMNIMVIKIREMFQRQVDLTDTYRRDASMDSLTQLPNREEFNRQFAAWLKSEESGSPGILLIGQIAELAVINDENGRECANKLLRGMADLFRQVLGDWPRALASRRTGSDFVLFVPGMLESELKEFIEHFRQRMESLLFELKLTENSVLLGSALSAKVEDLASLLSAADSALREAGVGIGESWRIVNADSRPHLPAREWKERLLTTIKEGSLNLVYQTVFDTEKKPVSHEVFVRLKDENETYINAGVFWPIAERFQLVEQLDRLIIQQALLVLRSKNELQLSVNLSPQSIARQEFTRWLEDTFTACPECSRLTLELPERVLRMPIDTLAQLFTLAEKYRVNVGLDHFGNVPSALGSLQQWPLSYVKVDRRFIHDANKQNFYLKTLVQIARSCEVNIYVEGVESEEQWLQACEIGLAGGQGYWLARPISELVHV